MFPEAAAPDAALDDEPPEHAARQRIPDAASAASAARLPTCGIDLIAQCAGGGSGCGGEICAGRRVENCAGRADDEACAVFRAAVQHGLRDITALRTHAGHEERQLSDDLANFSKLTRIRGANDKHAVAA